MAAYCVSRPASYTLFGPPSLFKIQKLRPSETPRLPRSLQIRCRRRLVSPSYGVRRSPRCSAEDGTSVYGRNNSAPIRRQRPYRIQCAPDSFIRFAKCVIFEKSKLAPHVREETARFRAHVGGGLKHRIPRGAPVMRRFQSRSDGAPPAVLDRRRFRDRPGGPALLWHGRAPAPDPRMMISKT